MGSENLQDQKHSSNDYKPKGDRDSISKTDGDFLKVSYLPGLFGSRRRAKGPNPTLGVRHLSLDLLPLIDALCLKARRIESTVIGTNLQLKLYVLIPLCSTKTYAFPKRVETAISILSGLRYNPGLLHRLRAPKMLILVSPPLLVVSPTRKQYMMLSDEL